MRQECVTPKNPESRSQLPLGRCGRSRHRNSLPACAADNAREADRTLPPLTPHQRRGPSTAHHSYAVSVSTGVRHRELTRRSGGCSDTLHSDTESRELNDAAAAQHLPQGHVAGDEGRAHACRRVACAAVGQKLDSAAARGRSHEVCQCNVLLRLPFSVLQRCFEHLRVAARCFLSFWLSRCPLS